MTNKQQQHQQPFGKVSIKILAARDTLICDISSSDPYCLVSSKDSSDNLISPIFKTNTIYKTLNPVWSGEEFIFDVIGNSQIISILMYDEDTFSKDDFMGLVKINVDEYKTKGQRDIWIPLEGKNPNKKPKKRGDIHIQLCYHSYHSLSNFLKNENHNIISKLSRQLITDDLAKAIIYYFSNENSENEGLICVIKDITEFEIEQTTDANVLFRTDSLATKIIVSTLKTVGHSYLKEALCPLISSMIRDNIKLEVDPSKGVTEAEAQSNSIQLSHYCSSFITAIKASLDQLPLEIKLICNTINQLVEKKFPNDNTNIKACGGFFFLRFINPAIFSPEALNLIPEAPNANVRRVLTLISKILQNISNQVVFTSKEKYLESFNSFISERFNDFTQILKEVSSLPPSHIKSGEPTNDYFNVTDSLTLMKYTDTIISSIHEKRPTLSIKNNEEFNTEILNRYQLIQLQQKQDSKKLQEKSK